MSLSNFLDKTAAEILDGNSPTFSKRESKGHYNQEEGKVIH